MKAKLPSPQRVELEVKENGDNRKAAPMNKQKKYKNIHSALRFTTTLTQRGHSLMTSHNFGQFLTPPPLSHPDALGLMPYHQTLP